MATTQTITFGDYTVIVDVTGAAKYLKITATTSESKQEWEDVLRHLLGKLADGSLSV